MKANEFVKLKGIDHAETVANEWIDNYEGVDLAELKRLVESHELVESKGGLAKCKEILDRDSFTWCSGSRVYANPLKIAVADVESCQ